MGWPIRILGAPAAAAWQRPTDWPTMPSITSSDEKVLMLVAVWPDGPSDVWFSCTESSGNYKVKWTLNGTPETVTSNATAEHAYTFADSDLSDVTAAGFKCAIIEVTPDAGDITAFKFRGITPPTSAIQGYIPSVIEIKRSLPNLTTWDIINNNARGEPHGILSLSFLDAVNVEQRLYILSLQNIEEIDTSQFVDFSYAFYDTPIISAPSSFSFLNASSLVLSFYKTRLRELTITALRPAGVNCNSTFNGGALLRKLHIADAGYISSCSDMLLGCNSLSDIVLDGMKISFNVADTNLDQAGYEALYASLGDPDAPATITASAAAVGANESALHANWTVVTP